MNRKLPVVLTALGVATPVLAAPAAALAATSYKGASSSYRYGTLQVTITVARKRLSTLSVNYSPSDPRSAQLDSYAVPALKKEALKASSFRVHTISGVTYTTKAFEDSLYSAMLKAHLA